MTSRCGTVFNCLELPCEYAAFRSSPAQGVYPVHHEHFRLGIASWWQTARGVRGEMQPSPGHWMGRGALQSERDSPCMGMWRQLTAGVRRESRNHPPQPKQMTACPASPSPAPVDPFYWFWPVNKSQAEASIQNSVPGCVAELVREPTRHTVLFRRFVAGWLFPSLTQPIHFGFHKWYEANNAWVNKLW